MSKKILFSLSKAMTIILATFFTMLLLVGCPSAEDKQAEDMLGTNVELPGIWESQSISYTFKGKPYFGTIQLRFTDKELQIDAPHGISKVHGYTRKGISIDIEDPYSSPTISHSFVLEFSDGKFTTTLNDLEFINGISQKLTFKKIQDSASMLEPTDLEEEGSGGNTDIPAEGTGSNNEGNTEKPAEGTGSNNEENIEKPEAGTEYDDEENNLRYIVNDDRTLSVIEPIDSELADWGCIIPEEYEGIKVTSIENGAFYYCSSLTSITILDSVTSIGDYAFIGCSGLTSITVSDNNKYYKSIDGVLFDKDVQKIIAYPCGKSSNYYTIPDSVTSIGGIAFRDCSSLESITIPDSVTYIGSYAFYGCSSLTSILIPNAVTSIGDYAFFYCTSLTSITVSDNNMYYKSIDGVLFDKNVQKIIAYPCGKSSNYYTIPDSVTSIGSYAFYGCYSLTSFTIPDSVTSIGNFAFNGCTGLTSITVSDNNKYYKSIDGVLFDKDVQKIIAYPCGKSSDCYTIPDSVSSIGIYAFHLCTSLTSITIPNSVTSIGDDAFFYCTSLASITIPDSVTSIGGDAFRGCSSLNEIHIDKPNDSITGSPWGASESIITWQD